MTRRIALSFVLASLLIVPAFALALPSPETLGMSRDTDPSKTSREQFGSPLTIPASGTIVTTPALTDGRLYEFDVSGEWFYDGNASHRADMAFSTADGWGSASKLPGARSLMIDGQKQSDTTVGYRNSHIYQAVAYTGSGGGVPLKIFDNSYTDGNSGSLTVTIYVINKVTWTFSNVQPLPEQLEVGGTIVNVPPTPIPGTTVPPLTVGGGSTITVARLRTYQSTFDNGQPSWCIEVTLASQTTQLGCVADPARRGPTVDQTIAVPAPPQITVCPSNQTPACGFGGVTPTAISGPGGGIRRGSSLVLTVSWTGDNSRLWNYGSINGTSITQKSNGWAPFDPTSATDTAWFATNTQNLGATLSGCIKNPAPEDTCSFSQGLTIPGAGQFLQALFHTQVNGQ